MSNELHEAFGDLINKHWSFLEEEWPTIERSKYHRTSTKEISAIQMAKEKVLQSLGFIPVFFFLVVLFGAQDYSGPYNNVEKGILLLYHLVTGCSMEEMGQFIPKSSFHQLHKEFYEKRSSELSKKMTKMLARMFSNMRIRLLSALQKNPGEFRHITMFLDGHDTRVSYSGESSAAMYSYKLKKSGFRTQVCTDVNGMILFMSNSIPCRDCNDGTMFVSMSIQKKMHHVDCMALDGGYTQFVDQVIDASDNKLSLKNFCYPIRKKRGIPLSSSEALFNEMFGSFRSHIEATFGELVTTFRKFGNGSPMRVSTVETFTVQFQLACLLLNIKTFVKMLRIPHRTHHTLWTQPGFDFGLSSSLGSALEVTTSIEQRVEEANTLQQLQEQFLSMVMEDDQSVGSSSDNASDAYEVERILDHKGRGRKRCYLVQWKGYGPEHNTWVNVKDLNADDLLEDYWQQIDCSE